MAESRLIEKIIGAVATATGYTPVVKGGNQANPIEYYYSRVGKYAFRLEFDLNGKDLLELLDLNKNVADTIQDFGDLPEFPGSSISLSGGGTFTHGVIITQVLYFDVYDYDWR